MSNGPAERQFDQLTGGLASGGIRFAADVLGKAREIGGEITRKAAATVDGFVDENDDKPKTGVQKIVAKGVDFARKARLIERLNLRTLPSLIDDPVADLSLKTTLLDDLDSELGLSAPLVEEIDRIAKHCFDKGIQAERLAEFLEDPQILGFLIESILTDEDSHFRPENLIAVVQSVIHSIESKLKSFANRLGKKHIEEDPRIKSELMEYFDHLKETYDPQEKNYTVYKFIQLLTTQFPDYDVITWIRENKKILAEIISGKELKKSQGTEEDEVTGHFSEIVRKVYLDRAKIHQREFIRLNIDRFIYLYREDEKSSSQRRHRRRNSANGGDFLEIDISSMVDFFEDELLKTKTETVGALELRGLLVEESLKSIDRLASGCRNVSIIESEGDSSHIERKHFNSQDDLNLHIVSKLEDKMQITSSHVNVLDLLQDPKSIPPEIRVNYNKWFEDPKRRGVFDTKSYHQYLKTIFGTKKGEKIPALVERANSVFAKVNDYLQSVTDTLNIPSIIVEEVKEVNDLAELIKLCCTTEDPLIRFAARRKIETGILIYTCQSTPRKVFQKDDAEEVKTVMKQFGLKITSDQKDVMNFKENIVTNEITVSDQKPPVDEVTEIAHEVELIPAKFGDVECYLLPAAKSGEEGDEVSTDPNEYIGQKSLYSMITKLFAGEGESARDITDLIRMTFVVESKEQLIQLQEQIEHHCAGFGRVIKKEDRVNKRSKSVKVGNNGSKASGYKAVRYALNIPISGRPSGKQYVIPLEMRILLKEDLAKERSYHHPVSHKKYEQRRLEGIFPRLAPEETFPERYEQEIPDKRDLFRRSRSKIKRNHRSASYNPGQRLAA
ncbi:MAG: hypothetical protein AAB373_03000 [Patescibacteria group bacterium]